MSCEFWNTEPALPRPMLRGAHTADVAVIGGGMAGILIAHKLAARGAAVVVVDAYRVGSGQTAGTTAKLTAQHGACYRPLIAQFGLAAAKQYAAVNQRAVADMRRLIRDRAIDCDLADADAYLFSLTERRTMEDEAAAQTAAGLPAEFTTDTELPLRVAGAVRVQGQARFHPQKFLCAIAAPLTIFEHTRVRRVEGHTLFTDGGTLTAAKIVFAAHYPFVNVPGLFFTRLHQERSYVLALKGAPPIKGMYLELGGGLSLRQQGDYLLLGGSGHRTGEEAGGHYAELRAAAAEWFPAAREVAHWSAQDVITPDHLPYIGRFSKSRPDWFVATGFGKWGMSTSMVAATLLADLVSGYTPPEAALFSPSRIGLPSLSGLLNEGGHAVRGLSRGWIHRDIPSRINLPRGAGGVVRLNGQVVGLYHAPDGSWHAVHPKCPHLGCALEFNPDEKTWDCPCHGSRFDYTGRLLNNPAQQGLPYAKRAATSGNSRGE